MPTMSMLNDHEASAAELALRVVALAETLGLLVQSSEPGVSREDIRTAFEEFARRGVGRHIGPLPELLAAEDLATSSRRLLAAIEGSPLPDLEWPAMLDVLGEDLLIHLVGVSSSSLHRYRSGERSTPDDVAERLHVVSQIVSDLSGSYNEFGIRRWFTRLRAQLDGTTPADALAGTWSADDAPVVRVRELARALLGAGLG